jgi:hypothetical protein
MSTEVSQGVVADTAKLMMHRLIARQIRRDPTLVEKTKVAHARQADQFDEELIVVQSVPITLEFPARIFWYSVVKPFAIPPPPLSAFPLMSTDCFLSARVFASSIQSVLSRDIGELALESRSERGAAGDFQNPF